MHANILANFVHYAVDIIAVIVILISGITSFKKGFNRSLFGFVSTIVAIILANYLTKPVIGWTNGIFGLVDKVGNMYIGYLISFFVVFLAIKIVTALLSKILSSLVEKIPLVGSLNRLLGFVLGLVQGFFIVCGVVAVVRVLPLGSIQTFVNDCTFVKWLYNSNPLHTIFSWFMAR